MGHLFQEMNLFDSALIYYELCYELVENSVDTLDKVLPLHNIAEIYILKENFKTGLKILNQVKSMVDGLEANPTSLYYTYAIAYDSLHQDQIALDYYLKFYKESKESDNISSIEKAAKALYLTYKKINNSKEALSYYKEHIALRDSIDKMKASKKHSNVNFNANMN